MKREVLPVLLVGALALGVLATGTLAFAYIQYSRKLRALQLEANLANRNLTMFQQLGAEAAEYSKRKPELDRIFKELGINKRAETDQNPPPPASK